MNHPSEVHVLLAEDEKFIRSILEKKVSREIPNAVVHSASDGLEAIEMLKQYPIDVVVSDINMPQKDGLELLQHIREHYAKPAIPVIIITGRGDVDAAIHCIRLGAYDYLLKPFSDFEIITSVKRALDKRQHIAELIRTQENLRKTNEELQKNIHELHEKEAQLIQTSKLSAIGQLAAGIAHEVNNPMGAIVTRTQFMKIKYQKAQTITYDELNKDLDFILKGANRIIMIVSHINSFARSDEGQKGRVSIQQSIDYAFTILEYQTRKKGVSFKTDDISKTNDVYIWGEEIKIEQVFINLISNAIDANAKEIQIHYSSDSDTVKVSLHDNGDGISSENVQKIFDPFFTTKEVGKGTGLGLSIVYTIVKKHQGTIEVKSELGKGTVFTLCFPLLKENETQEKKRELV